MLLYLSQADVAALPLEGAAVRSAIDAAFRAYGTGKIVTQPKTSIPLALGHAFQSLAAVNTERGLAALKWIGIIPPGQGATSITASILLSDAASGELLCIMDGRRATALRTAAMTAVAAQYLARTDSTTIGFVGAGVQAQSHLNALRELLPALNTVLINSRSPATATRFAEQCRDLGLATHTGSSEEAVRGSDIVVTTVPLAAQFEPFLDAGWVKPGAFVAAVDLGRSWKHEGLSRADLTVVDEDALKRYAKPGNFVPPLEYAHTTLASLASGSHRGRKDPFERVFYFSSGSAVADLAMATLLYERALECGAGQRIDA